MNDFTITTVGRKEVSFTFEDAMYVAAGSISTTVAKTLVQSEVTCGQR